MSFLLLKNTDQQALIDEDDRIRLSAFGWRLCTTSGYVYKQGTIAEKLHKYVVGPAPVGLVTDHINGNKLDNRKANLRFVTQRENLLNNKAKTKPMFGIYHRYNKFSVQITRNKRPLYLGVFVTLTEAMRVRDQFLANENLV